MLTEYKSRFCASMSILHGLQCHAEKCSQQSVFFIIVSVKAGGLTSEMSCVAQAAFADSRAMAAAVPMTAFVQSGWARACREETTLLCTRSSAFSMLATSACSQPFCC